MGAPASRPAGVVVVGGGVVGVSAAMHLQRAGHRVTLIEQNTPGSGASGHNGAVLNVGECLPTGMPGILRSIPRLMVDRHAALIVRYRYVPRLSPWLVRFIRSSATSRVEVISEAMKQLTDRAVDGYRPIVEGTPAAGMIYDGGMLLGYLSERTFAADSFSNELRTRRGTKFEIFGDKEITALDPVLAGRFTRGVYRPDVRFLIDSQGFVERLAEDFVARGGEIWPAVAERLETGGGRVVAVTTSRGRVPAETVVIAAGAWSRRLVRQLDFDVPLDSERGYGVYLPDPGVEVKVPVVVQDSHIGIGMCRTGVQLTGIDELSSADAPARYSVTKRMIDAATTVFPELRTDGAVPWMHCRPSMPDSLPVIGAVPGYPNAYMAFGHGHKGLGMGGITGELVRQLVDGEPTTVDVEPYSPLRFSRRRRRPAYAGPSADDGTQR